jgi:hypothetical protein
MKHSKIKIFGLSSNLCWLIFIIAQVSIMAFMIATLLEEQWVKLDPENFEKYSFEGGVIQVIDGLGEI